MENLLKQINNILIISKTDIKGNIIFANKLFCQISEYSKEELINKPHNIVRHPDMPKEVFQNMWQTLKKGKTWTGKVTNKTKYDNFYITYTIIAPVYNEKEEIKEYISLRFLITEEENKNIEFKKSVTKLLNQFKSKIDSYEKNKDNLELKRVLEENNKLIQEIKNIKNDFDKQFNAKNKLLLHEMQILRNNNKNYQKTVEALKENNEILSEEIRELKENIFYREKELENKIKELEAEKLISKNRLDLISFYESSLKKKS
jgi:PAS domain S-box-containing protein